MLIRQGLADWRKERAIAQLWNHDVTLRKAAERADVSYVEMLTLAAEEGIDVGYTTDGVECWWVTTLLISCTEEGVGR